MIDILTGKITVIQPSEVGEYVDGRFVEGPKTSVETMVSVQPLKASEIQMLPEGRRNAETIKIYSSLKMFVSDELNKKNASMVIYDGKTYEVHSVFNWSIGTDIPHFKIFAIKVDGQGGGINNA